MSFLEVKESYSVHACLKIKKIGNYVQTKSSEDVDNSLNESTEIAGILCAYF